MISLWLLSFTHRYDGNTWFHEFAIDVFEVTLAMEYLINVLYWKLLFDPTVIVYTDPASIRGPFLNHLLPFILLNVEMLLNGFHFNFPNNTKYFSALILVYLIMNICGTFYQGAPVYYFITYDSPRTIVILLGILMI